MAGQRWIGSRRWRGLVLGLVLTVGLGTGLGLPPGLSARPALAATGTGPTPPAVPTVRLAGADRVATAVGASQHGWASSTTALLATAASFPDALAGAALARAVDAPLLLTAADQLPIAVSEELTRLGVERVVLLGGTAAIGEAVAAEVRALPARPAVQRLAGETRYATAAAIADAAGSAGSGTAGSGWAGPSGRSVILASGEAFADALAAGSLAAASDGPPILLTQRDALPVPTRDALVGLRQQGVGHVVLVGGAAAVTDAVGQAVEALGFTVLRLAGATRYETALAVVDHVLAGDVVDAPERPLVVSTGEGFPDALAAGALTARLGAVFTTVPTAWPASLHQQLRRHADRLGSLVVVGGVGAVGDHVVDGVARAVEGTPWFDDPADPLGVALDLRYTQAFTLGEDPWTVWSCTVPLDTADTSVGPDRMAVDLEHVHAAAEAVAARWATPLSAGRWRPTFAVGGTVTVPASDPWVRGGCVHAVIAELGPDSPARGVLVVMDAVGGVAVGGVQLVDGCDEDRCGVERSLPITGRHAVLTADQLAPFDGTTPLEVLGHELGHAMGWPHVFRPNDAGDQYEDPMDLMASAAGWAGDGWITPPGTMVFNRYAAGWIDPADVRVHRGGTATYDLAALGVDGVQMVAVPGTEPGAVVTLGARVLEGIDRALPRAGVEVAVVDQRGYPCGLDVGTCSGHRRMAPAFGRPGSADHVLDVGEGADVLGLRIDVLARTGSTFTVQVTGEAPTIPRFTD